jgi:hypothetical protein
MQFGSSQLEILQISNVTALVRDSDIKKVNFRRSIALVVVAGLEVASRAIEIKSVELLEILAIDANG